jgi:hypothetical protein
VEIDVTISRADAFRLATAVESIAPEFAAMLRWAAERYLQVIVTVG